MTLPESKVSEHPARRAGDEPSVLAHSASDLLGAAERRQITVLFCDVVGSTDMYSQSDAEDVRDAINRFLTACAAIVVAHNGFVAKYMGDAVLAYFGYPHALEDGAERAVRASFELLQSSTRLKGPDGRPLRIRVGAATGLAVIGDLIGSGASREVAVAGKTPNLASRIMADAPPDAILIADATHQMIGAAFVSEDFGIRHYRGFDEPVRVWRALREATDDARYEERRRFDAPFFGREDELLRLHRHWQQATVDRGRLVVVLGEAGIGKSALLRHFESTLDDHAYGRVVLQCTARHADSPLYPLIAYLRRAAGIAGPEPDDVKLARVEKFLGETGTATDIELMASLLSIPFASGHAELTLAPPLQKQMTLALIKARGLQEATDRPLLIVIEDVHWMDPTTCELFEQVIDGLDRQRVLIVATRRPGHGSPGTWAERAHAIDLQPLPRDAVLQIVERIAGSQGLANEFIQQIIDKSEGIPLFAEELTKSTIEASQGSDGYTAAPLSTVAPGVEVPLTLRDGLMARLDRLGPSKEVAQLGAVIGRRFTIAVLQAVQPERSTTLQQDLDRLVGAELVVRHATGAQVEYVFTHALVQEAAYESLLRATRRTLHARIAGAIETAMPDLLESEPETLALHWDRGQRPAEAAACWLKAGQRAMSRAANVEAIRHCTAGIALLPLLSKAPDVGIMDFHFHLALGQACYVVHGPAASSTTAAYQRAQERVEQIADPEQRYLVLYGIFSGYHFASKFELAREPANRFLELATRDASEGHLCQAHRMLGYIGFFTGDAASTLSHFHALAALYDPTRHAAMATRYGADCLVASRAFQQLIDCIQGRIDAAIDLSRANIAYALELGHPATIGWAYASSAYLHYWLQDPEGALDVSDKGLLFCQAHAVGSWEMHCRAFQLWASVRRDPSLDHVDRLKQTLTAVMRGNALGLPLLRALLAEVQLIRGQADEALATINTAIDEMRLTSQLFFESTVFQIQGAALRALGRNDEAESAFRHAIHSARHLSAPLLELRARLGLIAMHGEASPDERATLARLSDQLETTTHWPEIDTARRLAAKA